jgi:hypothetical protein
MRSAVEPNGAHGVELAIGGFVDCQAREDSYKVVLNSPKESPILLQQHPDGASSEVFLPRSAELSFSTNLRACPARAGNATLISNVPDANLWGVGMGGEFLGTGTTIASTSTVTVLNVTNAAGLTAGGAIACATGAGGALECREIKTVVSNAVTLKLALSAIPANGSIVYAAATYYLDATSGATVKSLQWAVEGAGTADKWLIKGNQLAAPMKLNLAPGTIPKVDWQWKGTEHLLADGTNVPFLTSLMNLAGTPITDQVFADTGINAVMDSELRVAALGVSTLAGTLVDAQQINLEPHIKYGPHTTPAGQNTVKQWVRLREAPVMTGNFALPYEDTSWRTRRNAESQFSLFYQIGSSVTGGAVMISVPRIELDDFQLEEVDELSSQRVSFFGMLDNQTGGTSNLAVSVFRIHKF